MDSEVQETNLEKEVARLTRRNKLLVKRIKRLEEENAKLVEELDTLDILSQRTIQINEACPECGSELDVLELPDGKKVGICSDGRCSHRRKLS